MVGWQKLLLGLAVIVAGAGALVFLVFRIFPSQPTVDERVKACYILIPENRRAGLNLDIKGEDVTVNVGGQLDSQRPTKDQLDAFSACLDKFLTVVRITTANQPAAPLGQVADAWSEPGQVGVKLRLLPGSDDSVLNNLKFGPAEGNKFEIVAKWCKETAACVACDPKEPTEQTPEVLVKLLPGSRTNKVKWSGGWAVPVAPKPWQIIDPDGWRYFYECEGQT